MPTESKHRQQKLEAEAIQDLESQTAARAHERFTVSLKVTAHPGSASDTRPSLSGVTADLSNGGCRGVFTKPLLVGDVYRMEFPNAEPSLPIVFARCVRCRFVHETAFEAGLAFFQLLDLRSSESGRDLLD